MNCWPMEIAAMCNYELLVCNDCGAVFADVWATFPDSPKRWQVPTCPNCGRTHFSQLVWDEYADDESDEWDDADCGLPYIEERNLREAMYDEAAFAGEWL